MGDGLFHTISVIRANGDNFKRWEKEENDNDARRKVLSQTNSVDPVTQKAREEIGKKIIDVVSVMDQQSENMAEDIETTHTSFVLPIFSLVGLIIGTLSGLGLSRIHAVEDFANKFVGKLELSKNAKAIADKFLEDRMFFPYAGQVLGGLGGTIAGILFGTKWQINASRVARWQARENLTDKDFVIYTEEQKEAARRKVAASGEYKKEKTQNYLQNITTYFRDKKNYDEWKENDRDESKLVTRELSAEEIKQAKADKELTQRIVKKINNRAEEYSENMETAAVFILASNIITAPLTGWVSNFLDKKLHIGEGLSNFAIKHTASKNIQNFIKENQKIMNPDDFLQTLKEKIKEEKLPNNFVNDVKNFITKLVVTPFFKKGFIGWGTGLLVPAITGTVALKLQKNAARTGRFMAKKDLLNNPSEFDVYDEEDMKSVSNVKHKDKPVLQKLKDYLLFIPRCLFETRAYSKYKKGKGKFDLAVNEELKANANVSEEQLRNARNLKLKVFNTFEKVDEKSQVYSENMEAANEIGQQLLSQAGSVAIGGAGIYGGCLIAEKPQKIIEPITGLMKKFSKSNFVNKTLNGLLDNINGYLKDEHLLSAKQKEELFKKLIEELKTQGKLPEEMIKMLGNISFKEMENYIRQNRQVVKPETISSEEILKGIENFMKDKDFGKSGEKILNNLKEILNNNKELISKINEMFVNGSLNPANIKHITEHWKKYLFKALPGSSKWFIGGSIISVFAAFNAMMFGFQAFLSNMEKKAGRLGVREALNELDDYRYYADAEHPKASVQK